MGVLKELQNILPRNPLITIYEFFIRSHIDYRVIFYDQPNNETFSYKNESINIQIKLRSITAKLIIFKKIFPTLSVNGIILT